MWDTPYHEKLVHKIGQLEQDDTLRVDYTTLQADNMFDSKQSEVARRVAKLGIYKMPYPAPIKIKLK